MNLKVMTLGLGLVAAGATCRAEGSLLRHEILGGSSGFGYGTSSGWTAGLFTGYRYALLPWLQLGGSVSDVISKSEGSPANHFLGFKLGPTFNYSADDDLRRAWFLSTEVGYDFSRTAGTWSKGDISLHTALGKRFMLGENVSYDPSIGVTFTRSGGSTHTSYSVTPISFSLHF